MTTKPKGLLAIAIEDRVDLWFQSDKSDEKIIVKLPPRPIPEGGDYFSNVYNLLKELFDELLNNTGDRSPLDLINSITATVVSTPGVVEDSRILLQIPLWHSASGKTIKWSHNGKEVEFFNFENILPEVVESAFHAKGAKIWTEDEKARFSNTICVVNDATACAANEHSKRSTSQSDFAYVKLHNGINVGVVNLNDIGKWVIKTAHAEAGHSLPIPHPLDNKAKFPGVCLYHGFCYEGVLAIHSLYQRANTKGTTVYSAWARVAKELEQKGLKSQKLDNALFSALTGSNDAPPAANSEGIEIISHYMAQFVYQLAISPLAPRQIVIGGRMAKPIVLKAIRSKLVRIVNGYPRRHELTAAGVEDFIVRTAVHSENKHEIEVGGALIIARSEPKRRRLIYLKRSPGSNVFDHPIIQRRSSEDL